MGTLCRWGILSIWLVLWLASTGFGQPPPPPLTAEKLREIVKAAVDEAIKPLQQSLSGLEGRLQVIEERAGVPRNPLLAAPVPGPAAPVASGAATPIRAALVEGTAPTTAEGTAADGQPPAQPPQTPVPPNAGGAPPVVAGQIVPKEYWSVEMAKKTGLYFVEPQITGAVKLLKAAFQKAGDAIPLDVNVEFNANDFRTLQIKLFEEQLKASGRTQEDQLQAWRNFWADWNNQLLEPLKLEMDKARRRALFKQAFLEGTRDMVDWAEAVEKAHDEGTAGTTGTAGAGGTGSTARSTGYLPPLAAYHHAKYLRRMHRLQGRIQAYRSY